MEGRLKWSCPDRHCYLRYSISIYWTFTQENSQSDIRANIVFRAAQPQATLLLGLLKKTRVSRVALAVPIRMHRWANKNHMTSFVKSCWQAQRSKTNTWPMSVVKTLSTMGNQASFTARARSTAQLKRIKKVKIPTSTASLCQNLSCDLSQKRKCNDKMKLTGLSRSRRSSVVKPLSEWFCPASWSQSFQRVMWHCETYAKTG